MKATYLLRFDDICPTMNWAVWNRIEDTLLRCDIRPLIAVIPDNRDPSFLIEPPKDDFWRRVREWDLRGWTIGLHGCHHEYITTDAGIIGKNPFSEFAGLSRDQQETRLRHALNIFAGQDVKPTVWIAPGHSFDATTLQVLRDLSIGIVSDGYAIYPSIDRYGTFWIPQQLHNFQQLPCGVWTICLHHNTWTAEAFSVFERNVEQYRGSITSTKQVIAHYCERSANALDHAFDVGLRIRLAAGAKLRNWIRQTGARSSGNANRGTHAESRHSH